MRRQRWARERQEKREDRRLILKKLCAALLRSFRRQHREKIVCARGVPGVTGTFGRVDSHFDPTQTGDCTATLRWLFIGAVYFPC